MLQRLVFITVCWMLASCSLYQSEGREFLEDNAIDFAANGTGFGKIQSRQCAQFESRPDELNQVEVWSWIERRPEANIFTSEDPQRVTMAVEMISKELQVVVCLFSYTSVIDMLARQEADIDSALQAQP